MAYPSFNLDEKKVVLFGVDSMKDLTIEAKIEEEKEDSKIDFSQNRQSIFFNEDEKGTEEEPIEIKSGGLGISHEVKLSENMSFTPYDSSDNSDKEFNKCIFDKKKQKKKKVDNVRKRYSNQGMAFQR